MEEEESARCQGMEKRLGEGEREREGGVTEGVSERDGDEVKES